VHAITLTRSRITDPEGASFVAIRCDILAGSIVSRVASSLLIIAIPALTFVIALRLFAFFEHAHIVDESL
jgi:hypothetical protein